MAAAKPRAGIMALALTNISQGTIITARDLCGKLEGYPTAGVNAGLGAHGVDLATPPAFGASKPGWTSWRHGSLSVWDSPPGDPENPGPPNRYRIFVDDCADELVLEAARPPGEKRLTAGEFAQLSGLLAGAVEV